MLSCYNVFFQILHEKVHDEVVGRLKNAYSKIRVGDPLEGAQNPLAINYSCILCTL